mmetsp:Transcript_12405/g.30095  ORF Transcript_12405/g.30095 Transcript_12405/m.30095 type:complete len:202 (-) Transcript_12405:1116-1721(-)
MQLDFLVRHPRDRARYLQYVRVDPVPVVINRKQYVVCKRKFQRLPEPRLVIWVVVGGHERVSYRFFRRHPFWRAPQQHQLQKIQQLLRWCHHGRQALLLGFFIFFLFLLLFCLFLFVLPLVCQCVRIFQGFQRTFRRLLHRLALPRPATAENLLHLRRQNQLRQRLLLRHQCRFKHLLRVRCVHRQNVELLRLPQVEVYRL